MVRARFFRFRDRASYKPSEVLGLFILSLFIGMFVCLLFMIVDKSLNYLFGY